MSDIEIEPGDYVTAINDKWRDRPPFRWPLKVLAVGARIKVKPVNLDDPEAFSEVGHRLLRREDVLGVSKDYYTVLITATCAYDQWRLETTNIETLTRNRDAKVRQLLQNVPGDRDA